MPPTAAGAITVLTVDDQAPFREAARAVVEATPGFEPLAEVASGREALEAAALGADLAIVDVSMPDLDGLETSRRLHATHPEIVVVLVSAEDDPSLCDAAASCGASAFLHKQHFRPRALEELWAHHGCAGGSAEGSSP